MPWLAQRLPQALKRGFIFSDLAARVELVPFPIWLEPEFFRNREPLPFPIRQARDQTGSQLNTPFLFRHCRLVPFL